MFAFGLFTQVSDSGPQGPLVMSFWAEFVRQFSQEVFKLESSNVEYICRICIVVLRHGLIAVILFFFIHFFLSIFHMLT